MYDIVNAFIDHEWISNYTGEQPYIYAISGILSIVFVVIIIDLVRDVFKKITR